MARRCELTGKGVLTGNNVSHANNKSKRRFLPNLKSVSLMSDALERTVRLRISTSALRSVEHRGGFDAFLVKAREDELSPRARLLRKEVLAKLAENEAAPKRPEPFGRLAAGASASRSPSPPWRRWWCSPTSSSSIRFAIRSAGSNLADLLTWGAFSYPLAFLVTDTTNRLLGPRVARRVVYLGFAVAVVLSSWFATPRIAIASGHGLPRRPAARHRHLQSAARPRLVEGAGLLQPRSARRPTRWFSSRSPSRRHSSCSARTIRSPSRPRRCSGSIRSRPRAGSPGRSATSR